MAISANQLTKLLGIYDRRTVIKAWRAGYLPDRAVDGWPDDALPRLAAALIDYRDDSRDRSRANLRLRWRRPRPRQRRESIPWDGSQLSIVPDDFEIVD